MQIRERFQALLANGGDLLLVHARVRHNVGERTALQVLHDDPQLVVDQKAAVRFDNVRMVVVAHDDHLVEEQLAALLLAQVHLFDGHLAACGVPMERSMMERSRIGRVSAANTYPLTFRWQCKRCRWSPRRFS